MIQIPCGAEGAHAEIETLEESGVGYTLSLIGGKYKMVTCTGCTGSRWSVSMNCSA